MAEHTKDFNQAKTDFTTALLESVSGLARLEAEQRLSRIFCDLRNEANERVRKLPVKVRDGQRL